VPICVICGYEVFLSMKPFELEIITPENTIFKGEIFSLIIPAYEGYMGIMAGHASFIGSLGSGKISFSHGAEDVPDGTTSGQQSRRGAMPDTYLVKDGFIEVLSLPFSQPDRTSGLAGMTKVTILAENILQQD